MNDFLHHTFGTMNVKTFMGGFDKNLCHLIWCNESNEATLIDASVEITPIVEFIEANDLNLRRVIITHSHHDHIQFLNDWKFQFPAIQVCGYKLPNKDFGKYYQKLEHHEIISVGKELLTILYTPGHYSDSICIWNVKAEMLFTGDTVFVGRTGRVKSVSSSIIELYKSVYDIILKLPKCTTIYPGHHYGFKKSISIQENISLSPFFQCEDVDEFKKVMANFERNRR